MVQRIFQIFLLILLLVTFANAEIIPADRRIDWSQAGIPGEIPNYPVCVNVMDYGAKGDGVTDDTESFQKAINAADKNCAIFVPEGKYVLVTHNIGWSGQPVTLSKSNIVLRGEGTDKTIIISDSPNKTFLVGGGTFHSLINVLGDYSKGDTQILLEDANDVKIGDYLIIDQENDPSFVTSDGYEGKCSWCGTARCSLNHEVRCNSWDNGKPCINSEINGICEGGERTLGHVIKVIGKEENTITIETGLLYGFDSNFDPMVSLYKNTPEYIGIENLYIGKGNVNTGLYIEANGCSYCWFKNIEMSRAPTNHTSYARLYRSEIRDNYIHHARCYTSNHGYGIIAQGHNTYNLIENNIFYSLASPISFSSAGGGNVVGYNYFVKGRADYPACGRYEKNDKSAVTHHGAHPIFNLIEGNKMNRLSTDFIWGSSSNHTEFRNRVTGFQEDQFNYKFPINIPMMAQNFNVVGNMLGTFGLTYKYETAGEDYGDCWRYSYIYRLGYKAGTGCSINSYDPETKNTLLRHGNYDYYNNTVVWDQNITSQILPNSLYYSEKPIWWNNSSPWPVYGPDFSMTDNKNPAQIRFEGMNIYECGNGKIDEIERIIRADDSDEETIFVGNWAQSNNGTYSYKNNYHHITGPSEEAKAILSLNIPADGNYLLSLSWFRVWNSADAVNVRLVTPDSNIDWVIDQKAISSGNKDLGYYYLLRGKSQLIIYANDDGKTSIDSIRAYLKEIEECDEGDLDDGDGCSSECKLGEISLEKPICTTYADERYSDEQIDASKTEWFSGQINLAEFLKRIKLWKYCQ